MNKSKIRAVGIEIEGYFSSEPPSGEFKDDCSVHVSGHSRDDCDCYDNCQCSECLVCYECEYSADDCTCHDCNHCSTCENQIDTCDCETERNPDCKNKNCDDENICDECEARFRDHIMENSVYHCENTTLMCSRECGCSDCGFEEFGDGEVVSPELNPDKVMQWIDENYPDETNKTCGLHIHMSFTGLDSYMKLMSREFYEHFISELKDWGEKKQINPGTPFWQRLYGENRFCLPIFNPRGQIEGHTDRYTQINYRAYRSHGTIEFRLLPAFQKKELSISAAKKVIEIVETYINARRPVIRRREIICV